MGAMVEMKLEGFKEFSDKIQPRKVSQRMKRNFKEASRDNGKIGVEAVQQTIQTGRGMKANSFFTVLMKGMNKPLMNHGDLLDSIGFKLDGPFGFIVGVTKNKTIKDDVTGSRKKAKDIAVLIISVVNLFFFLVLGSGSCGNRFSNSCWTFNLSAGIF